MESANNVRKVAGLSRRAFVLGHGQIGRATALRLAAAGWDVTIGQRRPMLDPVAHGLAFVTLDRNEPGALERAIGDGYDSAIDTVAYDESHADQWQSLAHRIGKLVAISSISVYCDPGGRTLDEASENGYPRFPGPIAEHASRVAPGVETYSTRKVALENRLAALDLPTAILRAGAVYGPGSSAPREWWFVERVRRGMREIPIAYGGRSQFHPVATANLAELVRVVLDLDGSQVLNAVDDQCPTVLEIGLAILGAMGSKARMIPIDGPPQSFESASPWSIPYPMIADGSAARNLGFRAVTDYAAAMPLVVADLIARSDAFGWREAFQGLAAYPKGMFGDG